MSYVALYRKFRPQTFADVKGQDHVVRTLRNQIRTGRTGHAYLFAGTRGTGKTSVAKIMARALNCLNPEDGEPCCECENCRAISAGSFIDVIEMDAASNNGVDDIRNLTEETRYTPAKGRYKVFIIDEAHMITKAAFNAFLKTLEEPPSYTVFILATTEPNKLPQTILSRVQRHDFKRIGTDVIKENLKELVYKEGAKAQDKALEHVARLGDGSMRDAVSLLDKCLAFSMGKELTYELVLDALGAADTQEFSVLLRAVYAGDCAAALESIDRAVSDGRDLSQFTADFAGYLRNVLLVRINPEAARKITGVSEENMALLKEDAELADSDVLIRYIRVLSELINRMRYSNVKRLLTEVEIIKLARPQTETDYESILDRVRQLEARPAVIVQNAQPDSAKTEDLPGSEEETPQKEETGPPDTGLSGDGCGQVFDEPSAQREGARIDWDAIVSSVPSVPLRVKLKKARAVLENGSFVIYAQGTVAKGFIEKELDAVKAAVRANGFEEEVTVKEGLPQDAAPKGLSEEELFRNINFEITREDF